ncbi:hypothetical protein K491DRAFT_449836 [Lophiostoma macrostomum CBS 122681]|uniref:Uncharacterized protein n=1 Tax=Lophiostoma macrostomum CBS 122681 TaxID=1314788 RepID=A0A6A6TNK6_9PLEO|nr:hypothetical protein K491DRAFT_449836 [Lophiostoma macrostomum CBS 122681]
MACRRPLHSAASTSSRTIASAPSPSLASRSFRIRVPSLATYYPSASRPSSPRALPFHFPASPVAGRSNLSPAPQAAPHRIALQQRLAPQHTVSCAPLHRTRPPGCPRRLPRLIGPVHRRLLLLHLSPGPYLSLVHSRSRGSRASSARRRACCLRARALSPPP